MSLEIYNAFIRSVHDRWQPHENQALILNELFGGDPIQIGVECGRNFGKSELSIYSLYRTSVLHPRSTNYYMAPLQNQGREIIWASDRLQSFAPDFIKDINATEMRITFFNDSFIKVDGSDNVDKYRGVKMINRSLMVLDEYKDFRPEFYRATDPNLLDASMLILGTPPENDTHFQELMDEFAKNPAKRYYNFSSFSNPHISRAWLEAKRLELYSKGEGDVWEREYMAKRVKGGKNAVFPMAATITMEPLDVMWRRIAKDARKMQWYLVADPGTITCFGALVIAFNPYSKDIYFLDSIYEKDQTKTTVDQIGRQMVDKKARFSMIKEWEEVADEAAAWFIAEARERHRSLNFRPTRKSDVAKETGIGLIKDILLRGKAHFSDHVGSLVWELQNAVKDKHGKVPKINDHLIDCFRYFLADSAYVLESEQEPVEREKLEDFRGARIEDDFPELRDNGEWDNGD